MTRKELTRKVKKLVLANNLDYVGIAPAESLKSEPEGIKPDDFLPGAQSVVCLGIKLSLGSQLANKMAHRYQRNLIYSYLWHGFGLPSLHFIDRTALLVTRLLEKEGYLAVPVMSASTFDTRSSIMEFSNQHAAIAAGLGDLGWSGLVLTPDMGPRTRFGSVITNAKLETEGIYRGPRLCDVEKCKELGQGLPLCAKLCPTKALRAESDNVIIGDRGFQVAKFDRYRCMWASMGLTKKALGLKEIPMPENVTPEDVMAGMKERDAEQVAETLVIKRGDYCGKCIMECPVGSPAKIEEVLFRTEREQPQDG